MEATSLVLLGSFASSPALAAPEVDLARGRTAIASCLDDPSCEGKALSLLGENMSEFGLAMQSDPIATSALAGKGWGPVLEIRLDSFTLGKENALEERARTPPAYPRVGLGWQLGQRTWDGRKPQVAIGATALPNVGFGGKKITTVSLDASAAVPVISHVVWLGAEASFMTGMAKLPIVGTESQRAGFEDATGIAVAPRDRCEEGCVDAFRQSVWATRFGVSIDPAPGVFAYSRVQLADVSSSLEIRYDNTRWTLDHFQVQSQSGLGVRAGLYQIAAGVAVAPRPASLATLDEPVLVKAVASTSWRLGKHRVRSVPEEPEAPPTFDLDAVPEA